MKAERGDVTKDNPIYTKAWNELMAAFCKLRALVEEGGGTVTMELKVKGAKKSK